MPYPPPPPPPKKIINVSHNVNTEILIGKNVSKMPVLSFLFDWDPFQVLSIKYKKKRALLLIDNTKLDGIPTKIE